MADILSILSITINILVFHNALPDTTFRTNSSDNSIWNNSFFLDVTSFTLRYSFVEMFWLKQFCSEAKADTVTTRMYKELQLRWSQTRCWSHCRLLPHTQHHEVASAPCQAWISSTLLNFQWAVTFTIDSTGGTGPWMLTEVFVLRRSFQGNFRTAATLLLLVNPTCCAKTLGGWRCNALSKLI